MANLNHNEIPVALPAKSKMDLSCDHVTTMMFGEMQPVHYRHPIKGERLNLDGIGKIRPFPMACPTYGRMRLNLHHFFVPFRTVMPQFDSFYNDTVGVNYNGASLVADSPYFTSGDIASMYSTPSNNLATAISNWQSGDPFDFKISNVRFRFTKTGKYLYKILVSLGYEINWDPKDHVQISALALLCYARVYLDWYANQSYMDSGDVIYLKQILAYNDPTTQLHVDTTMLSQIFSLFRYVTYDQDYFTGSWDNPFAPNATQYSAISFTDVVSGAYVDNSAGDGSPLMYQGAASAVTLGSQYLHDALKAITDYSKRHQLAGATNINRALSQYGFGVNPMRVERSYHIGDSSIDVETGAVFSTANTAAANNPSTLGDFAGQGLGKGSSSFDFRVDELGLEVTIASLLPSGGYFQGMDENNMHIKKLQFFNPEFDGLGVQTIRKREVYTSNDGDYGYGGTTTLKYDQAFGFTGRYGEYKRPRSWVSGDLRCPTRYRGGDSWHLMRQFNDASFGNIANQVHSLVFTTYHDQDTYRRIFTQVDTDNDPFVAEFHWAVGAYAPCHGLFETYEFDSQGNKEVSLKSQGGVLN